MTMMYDPPLVPTVAGMVQHDRPPIVTVTVVPSGAGRPLITTVPDTPWGGIGGPPESEVTNEVLVA